MEKNDRTRRTYEKPHINQVRLVVEEAVLQACKVSTELAKDTKACDHPGCKRPGS